MREPLVECFTASFEKGEMSPLQKQAVITLIEKKDQDRCDLPNWTPISLLNVDTKIASKVIAEKIINQDKSQAEVSMRIYAQFVVEWTIQKLRYY